MRRRPPRSTLDRSSAASDVYKRQDIGTFYRTSLGQSGRRNYLNLGLAITNIGSKVTYVKNLTKDFIPTNLSIGANYEMNFDDYNSLNLIGDCLLYTSPSPRDRTRSRMPSSA